MKKFKVFIKHEEKGRILETFIWAEDKLSARLLADLMFNVSTEEAKQIRAPQEVFDL